MSAMILNGRVRIPARCDCGWTWLFTPDAGLLCPGCGAGIEVRAYGAPPPRWDDAPAAATANTTTSAPRRREATP